MGICMGKNADINDCDGDDELDWSDGNVHVITDKGSWDERMSEAKKDGKILLANFSASWCGPCKLMARYYSELSKQHPSLIFVIVDVDESSDFTSSWDVQATPTFFFIKDGQQLDKLVGANRLELERKLISFSTSFVKSSQ